MIREARPSCRDCGRPLVAWVRAEGADESSRVAVAGACFCDRLTVLPTRTRILLLQHPREEDMPIGTARMAHRALPNSSLRVGVDFSDDPVVVSALSASPSPHVLFPGPDAVPLDRLPRDRPITLVVIDGTWSQARKLLRLNPAIAALPRVGFTPPEPSAYIAIRKEPADFCVSTIEALAAALTELEPEGERFARLLDPFHAMVDRQRWFAREVRSSRHHAPRRVPPAPGKKLAARLAAAWSRLVCVHGEANAWPRHHPARRDPEMVHWIAHRPSTAATFEAVVAPRQELSAATPEHVELSPERLLAGGTVRAWHDAWNEFARPDDIVVTWGTYYRQLAAAEGLPLAINSVNLRDEVSRLHGLRFGTVEASMGLLGATPAPLGLAGRGGRRLAALVGALESLRAG